MTEPVRRPGFDARGLLLDGAHVPWLSAECHSWRLDPADWPAVLDTVVELGFTLVSAYVPWSRHERPDGSFDFTGALDVAHFVRLAHERRLLVAARIGPNCGAELEDSGWPRRVLDDPRCQALRCDDRPYLLPTSVHHAHMPSFGSRQTLHEVQGWYAAVAEQLAPLQWPAGPIVATHVDNEMGFHFQAHPFAMDYHPDTLAQWDAAHPGVPAPRGRAGEDEATRIEWVRFREQHIRDSLRTLATMQRAAGLDRVLQVHNDYPRLTTPISTGALERNGVVDIAAGDVYATRLGGRYVRDYARHLDATTTMAFLAEAGAGWLTLPWLLPMEVTAEDFEHCLWRALAGGVRALNVFMAVARDRWYGSAVGPRGERYEPMASVVERALRLVRALDWPSLRRQPQVLLLEDREAQRRFAARSVRGDLVPPFRQALPVDPRLFEGHDPERDAAARWERETKAALDAAGIDYDLASTECLPGDLERYELVLRPGDEVDLSAITPPLARTHPDLDLAVLRSLNRTIVVAHNAGPDPMEEELDAGLIQLPPYGVGVFELRESRLAAVMEPGLLRQPGTREGVPA